MNVAVVTYRNTFFTYNCDLLIFSPHLLNGQCMCDLEVADKSKY